MILNDNLLILRNRFPEVLDKIKKLEDVLKSEPVEVVEAKNGLANLKVERDSQTHYLHSKYDPKHEAEKFIEQFELLPSQHVFFYGLGLGYHIQAMQEKLGETPFTIYEPNLAVFYRFLCSCSLRDFAFKNLRNLYIGASEGEMVQQLAQFVANVKDPVLVVSLPSYRVIMKSETERFEANFRGMVHEKRSSLWTNVEFEKLWTVNSGNNFQKVLETPSILRQKKRFFNGKPALLVAAGPSLNDELDHIRRIKEEGLAYVFAVGSANRTLVKHGIYPDAVTAYDPTPHNYIVYEEIINQGIDSIPLIFGSSGSYNTVNMYPGPKLHMLTGQDSISSFLIGAEELAKKGEVISDAPSIAVLTLELLAKLDCSRIILVGQNFGYRNNQYYADGISYSFRSNETTEKDEAGYIEVEGVEGKQIRSDSSHIRAKKQMEGMLTSMPRHIEVINTTVDGAKIEGTTFRRLSDVIDTTLLDRVVDPEWYGDEEFCYDFDHMKQQSELLKKEYEQFVETANDLLSVMRKLDIYAENHHAEQIKRTLPKFDKLFKRIIRNKYASVLVLPLIRVQYELLQKSIPDVRMESDPIDKAKQVITVFGKFIGECKNTHEQLGNLLFNQVEQNMTRLSQRLDISRSS